MKVIVKGVRASYAWKWKIKEDICGICQQPFEQMCSECTHPIRCMPVTGECKHCYHKHCIKSWVEANSFCPICRAEWKEKE
ncbi:anaphase-promoting complex subunit 11 [Nematocida sp. AWRm77]|nr:anaphase-promoting complex subunit 11 [Nematocida sp. AWRm77]